MKASSGSGLWPTLIIFSDIFFLPWLKTALCLRRRFVRTLPFTSLSVKWACYPQLQHQGGEFFDSVSKLRRLLEFEIFCRPFHLFLQFPDYLRELFLGAIGLCFFFHLRQCQVISLIDGGENAMDRLLYAFRRYVVFFIVAELDFSSPLRFPDARRYGTGDLVGVHDHLSGYVPGRPPARLDQGTLRTEKPFLVCVQDRHKRHLRYVQPFTEEVDADQGVEFSHPQITDYIDPLQRVDVGMEIPHPDPQPFLL